MAELARDVGDVSATGDQERCEAVAEVVERGGPPLAARLPLPLPLCSSWVDPSLLGGVVEATHSHVPLRQGRAGFAHEHRIIVARMLRRRGEAMLAQHPSQGRRQNHAPDRLLGLRRHAPPASINLSPDVDEACTEVDLLPAEREEI
jgi:hypothetical protein